VPDRLTKFFREALLDAGEDEDRAYLKRLSKDELLQSPRNESPISLSGGSMQAPPPESGMSAPSGMMARLMAKKKSDYGDISVGGTGISMDTPQGRKNKLAATEFNIEKDGFSAGLVKPVGGHGAIMYKAGLKIPFKKGGTVRSKASKRADGIAVKGHTKGRCL